MHTGHQPQPNRPPNRLRNLPLILRPKPRILAMLNPPHLRHILAHHSKVLILQYRIDAQHIKGVLLRLLAPVLPLLLLGAGEVVGRVDVAGLPFSVDLPLVLGRAVGFEDFAWHVGGEAHG